MKSIFIALSLLLSSIVTPAYASLKLVLENRVYEDVNVYRPMLGVNLVEKLLANAAYNQFTGYGSTPYEGEDDTQWFTTKHQMDIYFGPVTVAPGLAFTYVDKDQAWRQYAYLKLELKIW